MYPVIVNRNSQAELVPGFWGDQ